MPDKKEEMKEKRFTVRLDTELYEGISDAAKRHRRSLTKEIECAVAYYLKEMENEKDSLGNEC